MGALYDRVRKLPLLVESVQRIGREAAGGGSYTRRTTEFVLAGRGTQGRGEDVTWEEQDQLALQGWNEFPDLAGEWTLESLSTHLDSVRLFPAPPSGAGSEHYRRWAVESAALDLALRQAGSPLHEWLDREPEPLTFVASLRLETAADLQRLEALHDVQPSLGYKLDPSSEWTEEIWEAVQALGTVQVLDLKGQYVGTPVDQAADPALYVKAVERFPDAWIEDPALTPETLPILDPVAERITWDAPIHEVADMRALRWKPRAMNIKPSRFGTIRRLFEAYEFCISESIAMYAGGQMELGVGRLQAQYLASLFHAGAGNDIAPSVFNDTKANVASLPSSPLDPCAGGAGFPPS